MKQTSTYTHDQIRLMKTQDVNYLTLKSQAERRKAERLREGLHLIGESAPSRSHIVFVDTEEEVQQFDAASHFDTQEELLNRTFNRPRNDQLTKPIVVSRTGTESLVKAAKRTQSLTKKAYDELQKREGRSRQLQQVTNHLERQKATMSSGRRVKTKQRDNGVTKTVYRWKAERKR